MWSAEFPGPSVKGRAVSLTANRMMGPAISADRDSMVRVWSGVWGGRHYQGEAIGGAGVVALERGNQQTKQLPSQPKGYPRTEKGPLVF